jgi:hypothetical protein
VRVGRRRFLQSLFGAACGVAIADDVLEMLDVLAPRPVIVPGADLVSAPFYSVTTNADITTIWRKVQADMIAGFNFECEEWRLLEPVGQIVGVDTRARSFTVEWSHV